jgi:catechol 2,3-dioxygenase
MNRDLTRRTLLQLSGASSLTAAAAFAARAEGGPVAAPAAGPGFASTTPIRVGAAALRVRDVERATGYYRDVIGLSVLARGATSVTLGTGEGALLTLEPRPEAVLEPPTSAGLFHIAFLMPSRRDLARWLLHVARNRTPLTGFADHSVSEAVYLNDPEGNGVEVYADRPAERWRWENGRVVMGTHRLDVEDILSLTDTNASDYTKAPEGLRIGHIHLRVGDVDAGDRFYRDLLGLAPTRHRELPVVRRLPSSSGAEHLEQCRRRAARRQPHRPRLVLADGPKARADARSGRQLRGGRHRDDTTVRRVRMPRPLGHTRQAVAGLSAPCPALTSSRRSATARTRRRHSRAARTWSSPPRPP